MQDIARGVQKGGIVVDVVVVVDLFIIVEANLYVPVSEELVRARGMTGVVGG